MKTKLENLLITSEFTIKDTLSQINENGLSACFVINDSDKVMVGLITDGDIRRAILGGKKLNSNIMTIANKEFQYAKITDSPEHINSILNDRIKIIPLLDEKGIPHDYATISRLRFLPIYEPVFGGNELTYITNCVKTGWISSQGAYIKKFENAFADFIGVPYALATSNGTAALHLALITLGIKHGDEVIVPDFTFAASVNAIIYTGAKPVLVDAEPDNFNIDVQQIEKKITSNTKAIMPVHLYGAPCNMDEIIDLAKKYKLKIVEDAAESFGSEYKGTKTGAIGDIGCFSFFGNKTITTGEGGMITFKNETLYKKAKILRDHGMQPKKRYWHQYVGYNYRMTNLQAAIGLAQIEKAEEIIFKKINLANWYKQYLSEINELKFVEEDKINKNTYWLFSVIIDPSYGINKKMIQNKLLNYGIETRNVFYPIHIMPPYLDLGKNQSFPNSEYISENGLSLPSSILVTKNDVEQIEPHLQKHAGFGRPLAVKPAEKSKIEQDERGRKHADVQIGQKWRADGRAGRREQPDAGNLYRDDKRH